MKLGAGFGPSRGLMQQGSGPALMTPEGGTGDTGRGPEERANGAARLMTLGVRRSRMRLKMEGRPSCGNSDRVLWK